MGWKWNDIAQGLQPLNLSRSTADAIDAMVTAKKRELADKLTELVDQEERLADGTFAATTAKNFHQGRASAFREVRDAIKP